MIHAVITFWATCQRTAEARRAAPAPMMQPVIVCVVETGMPSQEAESSITVPPVEALRFRLKLGWFSLGGPAGQIALATAAALWRWQRVPIEVIAACAIAGLGVHRR